MNRVLIALVLIASFAVGHSNYFQNQCLHFRSLSRPENVKMVKCHNSYSDPAYRISPRSRAIMSR
jgi:hypothetical protein